MPLAKSPTSLDGHKWGLTREGIEMIRNKLIGVAAAAVFTLGLAASTASAGHYALKCNVVPVKKVVWVDGYRKVIWVDKKVCKKVYKKHSNSY